MTEPEIIKMGFNLQKENKHDQFNTNRYSKGILEVEFTYEGKKLLSTELTISELNCMPVNLEQMKVLSIILGSYKE